MRGVLPSWMAFSLLTMFIFFLPCWNPRLYQRWWLAWAHFLKRLLPRAHFPSRSPASVSHKKDLMVRSKREGQCGGEEERRRVRQKGICLPVPLRRGISPSKPLFSDANTTKHEEPPRDIKMCDVDFKEAFRCMRSCQCQLLPTSGTNGWEQKIQAEKIITNSAARRKTMSLPTCRSARDQ